MVRNVRRALVSLFAVSLMALAGCSGQSYLPTTGGSSSSSGAVAGLEDTARSYESCLERHGLEATIQADNEGSMTLVEIVFHDTDSFMYQTPYGSGVTSAAPDDETKRVFDQSVGIGGYRLVINGQDYSQAYGECHQESGYTEVGKPGLDITQPDTATIEALMRASGDWADCARTNGWPQVADPVWPTDSSMNQVMIAVVLLPYDISADQLRVLVSLCPVEPVAVEGSDNPRATVYPTIGFDYPGFDGRLTPGQKFDTSNPEYQRLADLMQILYAQADTDVNGGQGG